MFAAHSLLRETSRPQQQQTFENVSPWPPYSSSTESSFVLLLSFVENVVPRWHLSRSTGRETFHQTPPSPLRLLVSTVYFIPFPCWPLGFTYSQLLPCAGRRCSTKSIQPSMAGNSATLTAWPMCRWALAVTSWHWVPLKHRSSRSVPRYFFRREISVVQHVFYTRRIPKMQRYFYVFIKHERQKERGEEMRSFLPGLLSLNAPV